MLTPRKNQDFLSAVEAAIRRFHMLDEGDTVLVGVSGGPDSVALLHSLVILAPRWSLRLVVACLNHQLRGKTADQEAAFVRRLAAGLGIRCEIGSKNVPQYLAEHRLSLQEGARVVRYAFYDEVADKYSASKIALGHHADDNAESILMHLLRGTGPLGLTGIPPVRHGRIIRPLIGLTKKEILAFLEQGGFEYVRDRSNLDTKYLRNRIRHELLPCLEADYNPNMVCTLNRLALIVRDEEDFWDQEVKRTFQDLVLEQTPDRLSLSARGLSRLHPALLRRLIRQAVLSLKGELKRLGHVHVEAVARLIAGPSPSGRLDLPKGVRVVRDQDKINFLLAPHKENVDFEFEYDIPRIQTTFIREIRTILKLSVCDRHHVSSPKSYPLTTALFDLAAVPFPLKVRNFKPGDRFKPLGMAGSQKVKTFFINHKVPRSNRLRCPIMLSRGGIIWVGGYRIDDSVRVTEKTKKVLKAELLPA
ncbi:MAG: tRNA lysidine(34) synthetase TilS [Deltaproteobacteria bacterium]|nr:tRNA lysidine(34) synthetase TilS [Deltaproteobacteria bacterium]MBW2074097.1 tRNA lysidine(34) synthetase TilS [Deltaproteobacteria bacterium]